MPSCSRQDVILVRYPFSDLSSSKIRPAVVVSTPHKSQDVFVVALTSKTKALLRGEFVLGQWREAGLNVETAVKRGIYTTDKKLVVKVIGQLADDDLRQLERSLQEWFGL